MPRSSKWSLPFRPSNQYFLEISYISHAGYIPCHLILLDLITLIIPSEVYKLLSFSLCMQSSPASCYFLSLRSKVQIFSVPYSQTPSISSSLSVRDQVSHPYKATGKVIVLCILFFKSLERKWKDKRF